MFLAVLLRWHKPFFSVTKEKVKPKKGKRGIAKRERERSFSEVVKCEGCAVAEYDCEHGGRERKEKKTKRKRGGKGVLTNVLCSVQRWKGAVSKQQKQKEEYEVVKGRASSFVRGGGGASERAFQCEKCPPAVVGHCSRERRAVCVCVCALRCFSTAASPSRWTAASEKNKKRRVHSEGGRSEKVTIILVVVLRLLTRREEKEERKSHNDSSDHHST